MRTSAKQRRGASAPFVVFWAMALCLALSAVQVSAAPDFIRSFFAGNSETGVAGAVINGPSTSTPLTSTASAASPIADDLYFFDASGVIARVSNGQIEVISGNSARKEAFDFDANATPSISDVTYSNVYSLALDGNGALYALDDVSSNVIKLDFATNTASVVANIPGAFSVVANNDATFLYYSLTFSDDRIYRLPISDGNIATPGSATAVGQGALQIFIVSRDESKIYGGNLGDRQFNELDLATGVVRALGNPDGILDPSAPQDEVPIGEAAIGGFASIAFYKTNTELIISSENDAVFHYDFTDGNDKFSQIAGNGAAFATDNVRFTGPALQNPTFPFFVSVSSAGKIYVDFQDAGADPILAFFEVLELQTVSITLSPTAVNEGSAATFTIARGLSTDQPLSVRLSRAGSTADPVSDYTSPVSFSGNDVTVTIPANSLSTTLEITASTDALTESAETVIIAIVADAAYTISSTDGSKTLTINDVPTGPTPGTGTIEGDPHFVGFEGQLFDFQGRPGRVYNLISDPDLQVNSLFGIQQNTQKTYAGGPILENISIFTASETVLIVSGGSNIQTAYQVLYNNDPVTPNADPIGNRLQISIETVNGIPASDYGFRGDDHVFGIVKVDYLDDYKFLIYVIENGRPLGGGNFDKAYAHRFLNLNTEILDTSRAPEGVLGQTHTPDSAPNTKRTVAPPSFQIKGTVSDYEVKDGIFGKDFTFNQFQTSPVDPVPTDPIGPIRVDPVDPRANIF